MIVLTEIRKLELIEECKTVMDESSPDGDIYPIYAIALASLTAEPVLYAVDSDVEDKIYTALCNENEDGAYPLFTAPPVPEIKLPPEFNESHDSFNEFRRGWNGAISEVKRINGLGE